MTSHNYNKLKENLELRNKLVSLGFLCQSVGPKGKDGKDGKDGEISVSSSESLFFTGFEDTDISGAMVMSNTWFIPNQSEHFKLLSDDQLEVQPGVYEITLAGLIEQADVDHGANFYLKTNEGSAIKDLSYQLPIGEAKQMHFSNVTIFRFDKVTPLQVFVNILGDEMTSNVIISGVNLLIKKIHTE